MEEAKIKQIIERRVLNPRTEKQQNALVGKGSGN